MPRLETISLTELWRGRADRPPWQKVPGQVETARNVRFDITKGALKRFPTQLRSGLLTSEVITYTGHAIPSEAGPADVLVEGGTILDVNGQYHFEAIREIIVAIGRDSDLTPRISAWDTNGDPITIVDVTADNPGTGNTFFDYLPVAIEGIGQIRTAVSVDTMVVANTGDTQQAKPAWSYLQDTRYIKHGNETATDPATVRGFDTLIWPANTGPKFDSLEDAAENPPNPGAYEDGDVIRLTVDSEGDPAGYYVYFGGSPYPLRDVSEPDSLIVNVADRLFPEHKHNFYRVPRGHRGSSTGGQPGHADLGINRANPLGGNNIDFPFRILWDEEAGVVFVTRGPWKPMLSGNVHSNQGGDLVRPVDLSFFEGRLIEADKNQLVGSRNGDFFNLYLDNVTNVVDSDAFHYEIGFENVGRILRLAECGKRLVVVSQAGQVEFGSGSENLTAFNGQSRVITRFQSVDARPGVGPGTCTIADQYRNIHHYSYLNIDDGVSYTSQLNIHDKDNWHDRDPIDIFQVARITYVKDRTLDNTAVHEIFVAQQQEFQSAWGFFDTVGKIEFVSEWLQRTRWVTRDDVGWTMVHYIHEEVQPPEDAAHWFRIDRWERTTGTYDGTFTYFAHSDRDATLDSRVVLMQAGRRHEILVPEFITTAGEMAVRGNHSQATGDLLPYIGFSYITEMELAHLYAGLSAAVVLIPRLWVFHEDSSDYVLEVIHPDGTVVASEWQADVLGVDVLDVPKDDTFFSEHSPAGDARRLRLRLANRGAGRATWNGIQYEVDVKAIGI